MVFLWLSRSFEISTFRSSLVLLIVLLLTAGIVGLGSHGWDVTCWHEPCRGFEDGFTIDSLDLIDVVGDVFEE